MSRTLIKNATIILPEETVKASLLIEDGRIAGIDPPLQAIADETVDASGKFLMAGAIDTHVHFREPGLTHKEDWRHATRACAKGGVTSFLEMPNTIPPTVSQQALNEKLAMAQGQCLVNFGFYLGATKTNLEELKQAKRTPGIKIFIGSSTGDLLVDDQEILEQIFAETSLPICAHCEDESTVRANAKTYADRTDVATHSLVRDHQAALLATRRAIDLAVRHRHPFHVLHVSTVAEVDDIAAAPDWITGEVCPHHLFFNVDDYERLGSLIKMNPAVKTAEDNRGLWQALIDGRLQMIVTDHAPHTWEEKQAPYPDCPSGLPSVENYIALLLNEVHTGRITLQQVSRWVSAEPARIWKITGKGQIREGWDADLMLVDLDAPHLMLNEAQQTKCRWTPWHGQTCQGSVIRTWVRGQTVYQKREGVDVFANNRQIGQELQFHRDG